MKAIILASLLIIGMGCSNSKSYSTAAEEFPVPSESTERVMEVSPLIVKRNTAFTTGDAYTILDAIIGGDILTIAVQYGGGCKTHEFDLYTDGAIMKSLPPQMNLTLHHNANQDMCRALVIDTIYFNVASVKSEDSGSLIFRLNNYEPRIEYNH